MKKTGNTETTKFKETKKLHPHLKPKCQQRLNSRRLKAKPFQRKKRKPSKDQKNLKLQEKKVIENKLKRKRSETFIDHGLSEDISSSKRRLHEGVLNMPDVSTSLPDTDTEDHTNQEIVPMQKKMKLVKYLFLFLQKIYMICSVMR